MASSADNDPVELTRLNPVEAELLAARLRDAGIGTDVLDEWAGGELAAVRYSDGARLMVRRGDLTAAQAVLADLTEGGGFAAMRDVPDLDAQAEAATDTLDPGSGAVV